VEHYFGWLASGFMLQAINFELFWKFLFKTIGEPELFTSICKAILVQLFLNRSHLKGLNESPEEVAL